nr:hypothetical protein [Tanacetum cinerariifolium]
MVEAGHVAYTDRFHKLVRLVPHLVTPENKRIERAVQKAGTLTDEAIRNGSLKKNHEKRGNNGESSRDRNVRDDNKMTRTRNSFLLQPLTYYGRLRHMAQDCRVAPRMVNLVEPSTKTRGNLPNQVFANNEGQGHENNGNQARGMAFKLGSEEARQDPNIVTGIEPNDLGFSYEIEIARGQLVKIDKVIKGCKLEIEGHMFDINLIPFESGSFNVIIVMDWLSNHKGEIIYYEKVVRIPLPDDKVLRVTGERPKEKMRHVMSAKANEQKKKDCYS